MNILTKRLASLLLGLFIMHPAPSYSMHYVTNFITQNKKLSIAALTVAAVGTAGYYIANQAYKNYMNTIRWDWAHIDPTHITKDGKQIPIAEFFKQHAAAVACKTDHPGQNQWLWGAATSAHQVEGNCTNNQWHSFENKEMDGKTIEPAGIGCDSWNHEDEDIANMKALGINTYRFSVEWSKVIPEQGKVDLKVLNHYKQFCQKLVANGIKPIITLYHYTEPKWFYALGGFEKHENIRYFVEFCTIVFSELHEYVHLWLTFNSPSGVAAQGWLTGTKPPAKKDMKLMAHVFFNLLSAHVQIYRELKEMDGGKEARIGILKNIMQLDPLSFFNPIQHFACKVGNDLVNESMYTFFKTGTFKVWVPGKVSFQATDEYIQNGGKCMDFIGLNYYCHNYMTSKFKPIREPNPEIEIPTNNDKYTIYGEGLYRAIKELSDNLAHPLNVPIYVTENGIGTDNDAHRTLHNQRYLYALARAIQDGYDVRGYVHWSLMDNYEWGQYGKHYGLYHINRTILVNRTTPALTRTFKPGAQYFKDVVTGSNPAIAAKL